jgi:hypothetical protein
MSTVELLTLAFFIGIIFGLPVLAWSIVDGYLDKHEYRPSNRMVKTMKRREM